MSRKASAPLRATRGCVSRALGVRCMRRRRGCASRWPGVTCPPRNARRCWRPAIGSALACSASAGAEAVAHDARIEHIMCGIEQGHRALTENLGGFSELTAVAEEPVVWLGGAIRLRLRVYLTDTLPAFEHITSVRAVV